MKDLLKHIGIAALIGAWFGLMVWSCDVPWLSFWGWIAVGAGQAVAWFLAVYLFCRRLS